MALYSVIAVDGKPYRLTGEALAIDTAIQLAVTMTPTRTSFLFQAGPVTVNATFLSQVEVCLFRLVMISLALSVYYFSSQKTLYNNLCLSYTIIYLFLQILRIT